MPKIKVKYILKSDNDIIDKEIVGIKRNDSLLFKDDEYLTNIKIIDNNVIIIRENNEAIITINLNEEVTIYLKENQKYINLKISLKEKDITDGKIFIKYDILYDKDNQSHFEYKLQYEVV